MTSANRILDIEVFRHPGMDKFVSVLEGRLRAAAQPGSLPASSNPDELISFLARTDKEKLKQVLISSATDVVGPNLPFDRLGDNIFSYGRFVVTQTRTPKLELGFNDVLYHIKTSNEILNPLRVFVTDKEFVKLYVKAVVGDEFNIPSLAILKSDREIDEFDFPNDCAIKPTHLSGKYVFPALDGELDRETIKTWLRKNHYAVSREANYRHLQPKIIVEEFIQDVYEVKFFCLYGKPKLIKAIRGGTQNRTVDFFDTDWNELPAKEPAGRYPLEIPRPRRYDEMIALAEKLSGAFNFVRVDLYSNDVDIFVGEITNCDNSASLVHEPEGAHDILSRVIFGQVHD